MRERRGACRVSEIILKKVGHFKDPGVDGRIILKWILEKWVGSMKCIVVAQHMERCGEGGGLVNAAINFLVS
jgi:hypothetical protein